MDSSKKDEDQSKNKKLENQKSPYKLYSYNSIRPTPSADSKVYKVLLTATAAIIAEGGMKILSFKKDFKNHSLTL